jgi:hypothetical protein
MRPAQKDAAPVNSHGCRAVAPLLKAKEIWLRKHDSFSDCEGREQAQEGNPGLLLMLLFLGTFDVHRRDWRALLRRMRLLRLDRKRQKMQVLQVK